MDAFRRDRDDLTEPHVIHKARKSGWIEVICGSMFSGTTEELIDASGAP